MKIHYLRESVMYITDLSVDEICDYTFQWFFDDVYAGDQHKIYHSWPDTGIHKIKLITTSKLTGAIAVDETNVNIFLQKKQKKEEVIPSTKCTMKLYISIGSGGEG